MASEHHSWFKSALPEQHAALSEWIKGQAINGDDFTQPMADIASSSVCLVYAELGIIMEALYALVEIAP